MPEFFKNYEKSDGISDLFGFINGITILVEVGYEEVSVVGPEVLQKCDTLENSRTCSTTREYLYLRRSTLYAGRSKYSRVFSALSADLKHS